jgi:zinc transport system permease protein
MSAGALAIGMLFLSLQKGNTIDPNSYLFGSILLITRSDLWLSVAVSIMAILLYGIFYKQIFAVSFDEEFARSVGVRTGLYDAIFSSICSVVIVLGMRLLGSLLISSLIIFPTLTAMRLAKTFKGVVAASVIVSAIAFVLGLILSYLLAAPTGATVVLVNLVVLIAAIIYEKLAKS